MFNLLNASSARKQLYSIIDECSDNGATYIVTKKDKAVRIIDERVFQEMMLTRLHAMRPEILESVEAASKELKQNASKPKTTKTARRA